MDASTATPHLFTREELLTATADLADFEQRYMQECAHKVSAEKLKEFRAHLEKCRLQIEILLAGAAPELNGVSVECLRDTRSLFKLVRFVGAYKGHDSVELISDAGLPQDLLSLRSERSELTSPSAIFRSFTSFTFGEADGERHVILTIPTRNETAIRIFQRAGNKLLFTITGVVVPVPNPIDPTIFEYRLLLIAIQERDKPLDLLDATTEEIDAARSWTKPEAAPFLYRACDILKDELAIYTDEDPVQQEALEAVVLQAASHGLINDESARIHFAVFGRPGTAKGKLARAVEACQPVCKTLEAQCITEDGLYGNSGAAGGNRVVRAGLLAQAHNGAMKIEDIHQANDLKNQRIMVALGNVMERGRCDAANASRTSYAAQVAIYVDGNRRSDVEGRKGTRGTGLRQIVQDLCVPKNVLTRFDYIVERELDIVRTLKTMEVIGKRPVIVGEQPELAQAKGIRKLKVALALLREEIPAVAIPADVAAHMQMRFDQVINVDKSILEGCDDYVDFMCRGIKSYRKFVAAHARLCRRRTATNADVDATFTYVHRKFETVLRWLLGDASIGRNQQARMAARHWLIQSHFAGQKVTVYTLRRFLQHVDNRTLQRDLQSLGQYLGDNEWLIREA